MAVQRSIFGLLLVIALQLRLSLQISKASDPTYYAGVVEFIPSSISTPKQRMQDNLYRTKSVIESSETQDLDILVFPEFVLNNVDYRTYVPDPNLKIAPCDVPDYDFFLTTLSCAARSRQLYVVLNVVEKEKCDHPNVGLCDEKGLTTYNTNVVFDREGRVISRYRKTHLYRYEWYYTDVKATPELATFTTDFGVTFGHFICFDMLFYNPAQVLIQEKNITDIIYPTYWFSELPFLTAVQLQEGWSYANDVNLLAADASNPSGQNTGSGIYAGKLGRLAAVIYEEGTTTVLKAHVPKRSQRGIYQMPPVVVQPFIPELETDRLTKIDLLRDYNVDVFETRLLDENFTSTTRSLCYRDFCCHFELHRTLIAQSKSHSAYRYRLAVYNGERSTHQRIEPADLSVCAVIACTNAELYSCGHIFPEGTLVGNKFYFNSINITGSFRKSAKRTIMPSTVDGLMMPLEVAKYEMREMESSNSTAMSMGLITPKADILTFGIWANYYSNKVSAHNMDSFRMPQRNKSMNLSSWTLLTHAVLALLALLQGSRG